MPLINWLHNPSLRMHTNFWLDPFSFFRALRAHLLFKLWTCSLCLHFKTKKKKILRIFKNKFADFQEFKFFTKLKTFITHFFIIHNPSLWSRDVPQKIWARSVQPFWHLLDTNKQTDTKTPKQTDKPKFIYRYIKSTFLFIKFLKIVEQVLLGERAVLQCLYDLEGEELYSVKWYKQGQEFFRYCLKGLLL